MTTVSPIIDRNVNCISSDRVRGFQWLRHSTLAKNRRHIAQLAATVSTGTLTETTKNVMTWAIGGGAVARARHSIHAMPASRPQSFAHQRTPERPAHIPRSRVSVPTRLV